MKNFKYFFVFCAIVFFKNTFVAQAPGYMGKRLVVGYGLYGSPGIVGSGGETPVNILHEGYLEYATSKRFMVGFSTRFYKAVYGNGREVQLTTNNSYSSNENIQKPSGYYDISAMNFMLYGKIFHSNYVAPWGRYFLFGASVNRYNTIYSPSTMNVKVVEYSNSYYYPYNSSSTTKVYSNFGSTTETFTKFDVTIGFGRSRIISNRVSIDYGYNVNILALALTIFDAPDDNIFGNEYLRTTDYIEKTSAARIRGVNRFNLFLKVGILLF